MRDTSSSEKSSCDFRSEDERASLQNPCCTDWHLRSTSPNTAYKNVASDSHHINALPAEDLLSAQSASIRRWAATEIDLTVSTISMPDEASDPTANGRGRSRSSLSDVAGGQLILRQATSGDDKILFAWRNEYVTRVNSFVSEPITWEEHRDWLHLRLCSEESRIYIGMIADRPIGQIRIDRIAATVGEISIAVDEAYRGRGFGRRLILMASSAAASSLSLTQIDARMKPTNEASLKAFTAVGFVPNSSAADNSAGIVRLSWNAADLSRKLSKN